jgi:hypothetical protein
MEANGEAVSLTRTGYPSDQLPAGYIYILILAINVGAKSTLSVDGSWSIYLSCRYTSVYSVYYDMTIKFNK